MTITGLISARIMSVVHHFKTIHVTNYVQCVCVVGMYIRNIYYIYERFSELIRVW